MRLCTRLYGEVNSVKNTTISIWRLLAIEKTTCFCLYQPSSGLTTFLLKEFYIICRNVMLRSYHHSTCFCLAKLVGCLFGQ